MAEPKPVSFWKCLPVAYAASLLHVVSGPCWFLYRLSFWEELRTDKQRVLWIVDPVMKVLQSPFWYSVYANDAFTVYFVMIATSGVGFLMGFITASFFHYRLGRESIASAGLWWIVASMLFVELLCTAVMVIHDPESARFIPPHWIQILALPLPWVVVVLLRRIFTRHVITRLFVGGSRRGTTSTQGHIKERNWGDRC